MIRRQAEMPVSTERLWEALTDPGEVAGWFGAGVEWDLRPGGRARFTDPDGGDREGQIEDVRPGRYLRFTWWPVSDPDDTSEVSYLLEPAGSGSRLTVQERRVESEAVVIQDTVGWSGGETAGWSGGDTAGWSGADTAGWSSWDARLLGAWGDISVRADARA